MSSSVEKYVNWKEFCTAVKANQYLQDESTDTSLQPGEEYSGAPHAYMVGSIKQKGSTMNQITRLFTTKSVDIPSESRGVFTALREAAKAKWLYPYTVENPSGTQNFEHWKTQLNTAVIQIVSAEFEAKRLITPTGRDLYSQGSVTFIANDASCANSSTARGLQICQPLLLNHMYYCKNRTLVALLRNNRPKVTTHPQGLVGGSK